MLDLFDFTSRHFTQGGTRNNNTLDLRNQADQRSYGKNKVGDTVMRDNKDVVVGK